MIETIAKFMGWERCHSSSHQLWYWRQGDNKPNIWDFNPLEDWNDWMLVEAKLHERGLWSEYIDYLIAGLVPPEYCEGAINFVMRATLPQRMEAATEVLKGVSDD